MDDIFTLFTDRFLLRSAALPKNTEWGSWGEGLVEEAILVSSPSLARRWEKIAAGMDASPKIVDKAVRSLERYRLRMSTRPTPFGLMAGVASGSFADTTSAELGRYAWKRVQPDRSWLNDILAARFRGAGLRSQAGARVVVNNTYFMQGDRVVVPVVTAASDNKRLLARRTAALDAVLTSAEHPVPATDLCRALAGQFPRVPQERIWQFLDELVNAEVLLSDWRPPLGHADPFAYILERDGTWAAAVRYKGAFESYQSCVPGAGYQALSALYAETGSTAAVHTDLAVDADVRLPREVGEEIARAASALWRLSSPELPFQRALRAYHAEFLERYAQGELVPVTRLLNEDTGLGPPADYRWPASHRTIPPAQMLRADRDRLVIGMAMEAAASGRRHIDLSDGLIASLEYDTGEPPRSAEVYVSVNAASLQRVEDGHFTASVSPFTATPQAGAAWGRFAHLLGAADWLRTLMEADDDVLPVQLAFPAQNGHNTNVVNVPQLCSHYLAVEMYDDTGIEGHLRLQDIFAGADADGFHLYHGPSQREIRCVVPHVLNRVHAPNIARFLWEASMMDTRLLSSWDWGAMANSPFLPGIRYGRVFLSPATWRLTAADLARESAELAVSRWKDRWKVPDRIRLVLRDRYLSLDLSSAAHRRMLHDEARKDTCVIQEDHSPRADEGWLRGPDGFHAAEIVVPLRAVSRRAHQDRSLAPVRSAEADVSHLPGGEWLSAYLYCSWEAQEEILRHHLEPWIEPLGKRWFFVRYTDPVSGRPHLRLRVRGEVLDAFHAWCQPLARANLVNDVALHAYRPEIERYGGRQEMMLAEEFFHADSRLVLARLRAGADDLAIVEDVISLIRIFQDWMERDWADWVLTNYPRDEARHRLFAVKRREALARVPVDRPAAQPPAEWSSSLLLYAKAVRRATDEERCPDPSRILRSVVHMHCNRALRPAPEAEAVIYAMVRGIVEAHVNRKRNQG